MSATLRDLKVWQEAVALAADVVRAARTAARREVKVLTETLMSTATDVAGAIAEGAGRYTPDEQQACYRVARGALLRLETQLAIARQAELLPAPVHAQLLTRVGNVSRLLAGYLAYLETRTGQSAG